MTLCGWPGRVNKATSQGNVSTGGSVNVLPAETFPSDIGYKKQHLHRDSEGNHPGSLKKLLGLEDEGPGVLFWYENAEWRSRVTPKLPICLLGFLLLPKEWLLELCSQWNWEGKATWILRFSLKLIKIQNNQTGISLNMKEIPFPSPPTCPALLLWQNKQFSSEYLEFEMGYSQPGAGFFQLWGFFGFFFFRVYGVLTSKGDRAFKLCTNILGWAEWGCSRSAPVVTLNWEMGSLGGH